MKKILLSLLAIAAVFVSCKKEASSIEPEQSSKTITISASCDDVTKSSYTDAGVFSWGYGDEIAYILCYTDDNTYNNNTLATNAVTGSANATFTGSTTASGYTASDLAFYPQIRKSGTYVSQLDKYVKNSLAVVKSVTTLQATLQQPIAAYTDRLQGIVPMIGRKIGEDASGTVENYHFSPVTGVLKVSFTGLPATATEIHLDMPDNATYALNGNFNIDTSRDPLEIKESDCVGTKWGQKYLQFVYASAADAFYFPIPTGTIPAGKLTVSVTDGTNVLYAVTNKQDIELVRGEITELPSITVPSVKVKVTGTPTSPKAQFFFSGDVAYIKYGNTMTLAYEPSKTVSTSGTVVDLNHNYNYKWPLQYQAYNSSNEEIGGLQIIYYYTLTDTGISEVCKQFTSATTDIGLSDSKVPAYTKNAMGGDAPTITFEVSDDATKGNIIVSEFCGVHGKVYGCYVDYETSTGTPVKNYPQIETFNGVFCTVGENDYMLKEGNNAVARFAVKTTIKGTPSVYGVAADIACWGEYVGLYSGSAGWGPFVHWFFDPE